MGRAEVAVKSDELVALGHIANALSSDDVGAWRSAASELSDAGDFSDNQKIAELVGRAYYVIAKRDGVDAGRSWFMGGGASEVAANISGMHWWARAGFPHFVLEPDFFLAALSTEASDHGPLRPPFDALAVSVPSHPALLGRRAMFICRSPAIGMVADGLNAQVRIDWRAWMLRAIRFARERGRPFVAT